METLAKRTRERMDALKKAITVLLAESRAGLHINELMRNLSEVQVGSEYNRGIVEHAIAEMKREGRVTRSGEFILLAHRREWCHRDDGTHHCKCCGSGMFFGAGRTFKCPACP